MGNVFALFGDISLFVLIGWPVFAAWTVLQVKWYQRRRVPAAAPVKSTRRRSSRRSAVRAPGATQASNSSMFTTLGLMEPDGASRYGVPMSSSHSGPTVIS